MSWAQDVQPDQEASATPVPQAAEPALDAGSDTPFDAVRAEEPEITTGEAFVRTLIQGGWTMAFLLLVSIFGLAYTLERFVHLRRKHIAPPGLADEADRLFGEGKLDELKRRLDGDDSTMARMLDQVVRHRQQGPTAVSSIAGDLAARDLKRHLQRAYPLAVVATLSPLLGLLGTVIGMIGAFGKVAAAGSLGDASILGGDISKALVTTGAGLGIAVPALALYHYFKSRTSLFALDLEEQVSELIARWFHLDEQQKPEPRESSPRPQPQVIAPDRPATPTPAVAGPQREAGVAQATVKPRDEEPARAD